MITVRNKYKKCRALDALPIPFFEDYLISRDGKLYHLDLETGTHTDISHIIFDYTKRGVPIYRILDLKDKEIYLELPLDKLILNTFVGDLEGKILHKDFDYNNCSVDNLKYELNITNVDNSDSLWINNKEFKIVLNHKNYYVSNNGMIYSTLANKLLKQAMNDKLYFKIKLDKDHESVHRLVYTTWIGEIPEGLTINHKDGNKRNNNIDNLETMTGAENFRHAQNNGLRHNSKWTEENIHIICKMMEDNKSFPEIAHMFSVDSYNERKRLSTTLTHLRNGTIWKDITTLYHLNNYDTTRPGWYSGITIEQIENICRLLEQKNPVVDVSKKLEISIHIINSIKYGLAWKDISSKYNIENYYSSQLTDEQAHNVCEMIDNGSLVSEISKRLDIHRSTIYCIKAGKGYKDISCNYNFIKNKSV
jgi:hypothetical protein